MTHFFIRYAGMHDIGEVCKHISAL